MGLIRIAVIYPMISRVGVLCYISQAEYTRHLFNVGNYSLPLGLASLWFPCKLDFFLRLLHPILYKRD